MHAQLAYIRVAVEQFKSYLFGGVEERRPSGFASLLFDFSVITYSEVIPWIMSDHLCARLFVPGQFIAGNFIGHCFVSGLVVMSDTVLMKSSLSGE